MTNATITIQEGDRPQFSRHFAGTQSIVTVDSGTEPGRSGWEIRIPFPHLARWIAQLTEHEARIKREIGIRKELDDGTV